MPAVLDQGAAILQDQVFASIYDEAALMAVSLNKFVVTVTTTVPAGAFTLDTSTGERLGTGSYAQGADEYGSGAGSAGGSTTFIKGQLLVLDSGTPSALYACLNGLGVLRAYVDESDAVGRDGVSN
jgi:hypothetical protein